MVTKTIETTSRPRKADDSDYLVSKMIISIGDEDCEEEKVSSLMSSPKTMFKPTPRIE